MFRFRRETYWDCNATSPVSKAVAEVVSRTLRRTGNPSSPHRASHEAREVLERSRNAVAAELGVSPDEFHFTGSATEAINQVLESVARTAGLPRRIAVSPIEHHAVLRKLDDLATRGWEIAMLEVGRDGRIVPESLVAALRSPTALVVAMRANNETGAVQPIPVLAGIARSFGALFLCDCVQAFGKLPLDLPGLGADYACVSAHKIGGPRGIGGLWARSGAPLSPLVFGGAQERGLRAGTEALHDIAGFAEAVRSIPARLANAAAVAAARDRFLSVLRILRPDLEVATPLSDAVPNTLNLRFPGIPNGVLLGWLDLEGVRVSAGSACATDDDLPSHVLLAQGLSAQAARESLRFSLDMAASARVLSRQAEVVLSALRDYFVGRSPALKLLLAANLADALADPRTLVVDMRSRSDRKLIPPLPGALLAGAHPWEPLPDLPEGRRLVVACQAGFEAPVLAWRLRKAGHPHVEVVVGGMVAWRLRRAG